MAAPSRLHASLSSYLRPSTLGRLVLRKLTRLVDVALVTLIALQLLDVLVRFSHGFAAVFLHDPAKRRVDILGHASCIAANKKLCALCIEPAPDFRRILQHAVLDINLMGLIA